MLTTKANNFGEIMATILLSMPLKKDKITDFKAFVKELLGPKFIGGFSAQD